MVTLAARHLGQHDEDVGHGPVGRPQLAAVEHVARAVLGRRRGRRHPGGIRAHAGLGQRERGQVRPADLRQPLALLLLRAGQQQRLRQPDRLMRRQQRREAGVPGPDQHHRAVVVDLGEPEAAVLLGHLHAQRAKLLEPGDHLVGDPAVTLDRLRIDLIAQERAQRRQEPFALLDGVGRHGRAAERSARAGSRRGRAPCRSWAASNPSPGPPPRSLELPCSQCHWAWGHLPSVIGAAA